MSETNLVNPKDFDVDLHDAYASLMGYFERKGLSWWNHSYAAYFYTFNDFLSFGWGAIVVTDKKTGEGHVVVRGTLPGYGMNGSSGEAAPHMGNFGTLQQFAKMIRTRFGESLPKLTSQLPVEPYESTARQIRYINDVASYKRLASTIPGSELYAKKKKARSGNVDVISELWHSRNHTFLALEITWWEKGNGVILEAGMSACRCRNIDALDSWPPIPDENYRRSHYVVSDWLDQRSNTHHHLPSQPRSFAHGESHPVSMSSIEKILNGTISSLASPEHESIANTLVILTIGDSSRLGDLKNVHIPSNCLIIDVSNLERSLYQASLTPTSSVNAATGVSGAAAGGSSSGSGNSDPRNPAGVVLRNSSRQPNTQHQAAPLSLKGMCNQLKIPMPYHIPLSNSGNAAFYLLLLFQLLVDRDASIPPILLGQNHNVGGYPQMQIYPAATNGHTTHRQSGSRSTPRQRTSQPNMQRAQTMFWDEAFLSNGNIPQPNGHAVVDGGAGGQTGGNGVTSGTNGIAKSMSRLSMSFSNRDGLDVSNALPQPQARPDSFGRNGDASRTRSTIQRVNGGA